MLCYIEDGLYHLLISAYIMSYFRPFLIHQKRRAIRAMKIKIQKASTIRVIESTYI